MCKELLWLKNTYIIYIDWETYMGIQEQAGMLVSRSLTLPSVPP